MREVTLIGQNVNAYHGLDAHGRTFGLAALIRAAAAVPGIARVRYTTSHPNDMSEDLIDAHRDIPELAPYLHLPVQSGSDAVLKSMNRRHRAADYLDIVARVRAARPDIALSSDFIVGYPGESDADFEATLALVRAVGFASAYAFKYSPRPGTPAAEMSGQIDEATKARRLAELQALIEDAAAGLQPGDDRPARRGSVREARPARGPGHRTVAPYAVGVRRRAQVAHRRARERRNPRRRASFAARTHCLDSVVNRNFSGVRDDSEPGREPTERANLKPQDMSPTRIAAAPPVINPTLRESKPAEIAIAFPDNAAASVVFGHYDQNIARIERSLGVSAYANGNQVVIKGPREASEQARRVFEMLYERVKQGQPASEGDVEGVIAESAYQGLLFPGVEGSQGQFRRRQDAQARRRARPHRGAGPVSGGLAQI